MVPLPKPARGLGRDSSAQVSSQDTYMREEMQGKTASKYGKDSKPQSSSGAKAARCVRNCPYQTYKTWPGPAAQPEERPCCDTLTSSYAT